ncbi:nucleotide exchange factor GrpE [Phormidesmis sp. 146-35]
MLIDPEKKSSYDFTINGFASLFEEFFKDFPKSQQTDEETSNAKTEPTSEKASNDAFGEQESQAEEPSVEEVEPSDPSAETPAEEETANKQDDLQATISALTQDNESLKVQLEDRNNRYMQLAADFENFRKRVQKEKEDAVRQVQCDTVRELLRVIDDFERARREIKPQTDPEIAIQKSYQGIYKQLVMSLKNMGVAPISAEGTLFDPNKHEVAAKEETDEFYSDTVLEELVRGYVLADQVLRRALVKVSVTSKP